MEPVAGRYSFERALLDQNITHVGDLVSAPPPIIVSNFDLMAGRIVLDDFYENERSSLLEMAAVRDVGVRVVSSEPYAAMDCERAAIELAESENEPVVNRVSCRGNNAERMLGTAFQYSPASYRYNLGSGSYRYDQISHTNWTIDVTTPESTQTAVGAYRVRRSEFDIKQGLVPVTLSGITLFVPADIKVNQPWQTVESEDYLKSVAFHSGRRFYIQCGTHTFFDDRDYFPDGGEGIMLDLSSNFNSYCADEDIVYRFKNMRNYENNTTTITFIPLSRGLTPIEYIGEYASKLEVKLNNAADDFLFYQALYNPTQSAEPGIQNTVQYQTSIKAFSDGLKQQMQGYAVTRNDLSSSDVEALFFADTAEVDAWAVSTSQTISMDLDFMVGVYKESFGGDQPEWFGDFEAWFDTDEIGENGETRAGSEVAPGFAVEAIQDAGRYALNPEGLDIHYAFGCKYLEAWESLTRTKVMADRYLFLMNYFSSNGGLPPAYSDGDNTTYERHKLVVSGELNNLQYDLQSAGLTSLPTWNPAARDTLCAVASGGGFSD